MPTTHSQSDLASKATNATREVAIYDGNTFITNVPVNSDDTWSVHLAPLGLGPRSLNARIEGRTSEPWTFTIEEPVPALVMDESPVSLQTKLYVQELSDGQIALPNFPSGSTVTRVPSGGRPPYTYSSSNSTIVDVTADGLASPRANGSATITVSDQADQTKSYLVTVSNVLTAFYLGGMPWKSGVAYQKPGGHLPSRAEIGQIRAQYDRNNWPGDTYESFYWSNENSENKPIGPFYWCVKISNGETLSMYGQAYYYGCFSVYARTP